MTLPSWSLFDDPADYESWLAEEEARDIHDEGVRARDRALEKVERGADPLWLEEALAAVQMVARAQRVLTSEDVAAVIERTTPEPRALGVVMRMAQDKGWIAATDRFVPATHPSRHRAPIRTWQSQLHVEERAA